MCACILSLYAHFSFRNEETFTKPLYGSGLSLCTGNSETNNNIFALIQLKVERGRNMVFTVPKRLCIRKARIAIMKER
jgi:hypothetical protein